MTRNEARRWSIAAQCFAAEWSIVVVAVVLGLPLVQRSCSYALGGLGALAAGTAASLWWLRTHGHD